MSLFQRKPLIQLRREVEYEEKRWKVEKELLQRQQKIQEEKDSLKPIKKHFSTSKILIAFLFLNCSIVEIFTMRAIAKMLEISFTTGAAIDFTPLVTLVGAVVGEVIAFGIYSAKATKENVLKIANSFKEEEEAVG